MGWIVVEKNRDILRKNQTIQFVGIIPYGDVSKKYFKVLDQNNACIKNRVAGFVDWDAVVFFLDNHALPKH